MLIKLGGLRLPAIEVGCPDLRRLLLALRQWLEEPRGGRKIGSKNRQTVEREKAKKIADLRAEIWKNAPPIDFKAPLDSLEIMEGVMRHFYQRALIEQRMGLQADWSVVDALMLKTIVGDAPQCKRLRSGSISWRRPRSSPLRASGVQRPKAFSPKAPRLMGSDMPIGTGTRTVRRPDADRDQIGSFAAARRPGSSLK